MKGLSQDNFESLGETSVIVNHKASERYSLNFSGRSRYYLYQNSGVNLEQRQIDLVHFSTFQIDYRHSLGLGVQYRFRDGFDRGDNELRLTQQFNFTKRNLALRFGHRFRVEQRIFEDFTIIRSRYRFALDFPLNGERLDVGEAYFVASMEALLSVNSTRSPELDHRTNTQIGWQLTNRLKIQAGLEYRFEAFNKRTENRLFLLTTGILNI